MRLRSIFLPKRMLNMIPTPTLVMLLSICCFSFRAKETKKTSGMVEVFSPLTSSLHDHESSRVDLEGFQVLGVVGRFWGSGLCPVALVSAGSALNRRLGNVVSIMHTSTCSTTPPRQSASGPGPPLVRVQARGWGARRIFDPDGECRRCGRSSCCVWLPCSSCVGGDTV